jgi:hypothetical protein
MGGVEFRMRPARQIQQLATARQRRSKRTDSEGRLHRASGDTHRTPDAVLVERDQALLQNDCPQRSATLAAVLRAVRIRLRKREQNKGSRR